MADLVRAVSLSYMAGDDLSLEHSVKKDGAVINISAMAVRFEIAPAVGETPLITTQGVSPNATIEKTDPVNGIFVVHIDGDETDDLDGSNLYFEAEVEDTENRKYTVARGFITFVANQL